MSKAEEYQQHAQQCLDAAQRIQNAEQRAIMLQIAQTWMRLGEKEDAAAAAQQQQAPPKDDKTE
jgi:putative IMPACT (imprinted ancient) family translation regulator